MRILVLGSGAREHALCLHFTQSTNNKALCAPGNPGMEPPVQTLPHVDPLNHNAVALAASKHNVDLVFPAAEGPLAAGIVDALIDAKVPVFGPSKNAAQLEASKKFTREVCEEALIPSPTYQYFPTTDEAVAYLNKLPSYRPLAVKADGLASGKGVIIANAEKDAVSAVNTLKENLGERPILLEELLVGPEISLFALCLPNGDVHPLGCARDHKRLLNNNQGPNTGGMGAFSPVPNLPPQQERNLFQTFITPAVNAMKRRGSPFHGILYAGIILTRHGPKLLEYNVRFGDPECQVLLPRLKSNLADILLNPSAAPPLPDPDKRSIVITLAAHGYPDSPRRGDVVHGLKNAQALPNVHILTAAVARNPQNQLVTNGGRVLSIVATDASLAQARARAYRAANLISWNGLQYRSDIAEAL